MAATTVLTDYQLGVILDALFGAGAGSISAPATHYFALFTTAPTDSTPGTEVSTGSYARVAVTNNTANWHSVTGSNTQMTNANAITWPTATAGWGTLTGWGIFDAATGGNLLFYGAIYSASPPSPGAGDTPTFGVGQFTLTI